MMTRRSYISYAAIGIMLIAATSILVAKNHQRNELRLFIETKYKSEIEMIENSMRIGWETSGKESNDKLYEEMERQMDSREAIEHALAGPEFFAAHWSSDGHHGMQTLKPMPTPQYGRKGSYFFEYFNRKHCLYYGEASDGTELLIYVGRVESKWKRVYEIAFRRTELGALLRGNAQQVMDVNRP